MIDEPVVIASALRPGAVIEETLHYFGAGGWEVTDHEWLGRFCIRRSAWLWNRSFVVPVRTRCAGLDVSGSAEIWLGVRRR
jgi:hypothetical protein